MIDAHYSIIVLFYYVLGKAYNGMHAFIILT